MSRPSYALLAALLVTASSAGATAAEPADTASSAGATAAEPADAPVPGATDDELIAAGVELRKHGEDFEALALFERAYTQHPTPRAAAQMALAHQALAHWREAESKLVEALGDPNDTWVLRQRAYLEESLATVRTHLAWVELQADVSGAEVWIGREPRGVLPLSQPLRVVAGDVSVEVRAAGRMPIRRTIHVEPASQAHETFVFGVGPWIEPAASADHGEARALPRSSAARAAGWTLLAGAGGLALVGAAGLVTREWEAQIYDGATCGPSGSVSRSVRCGTQREIGMAAQTIGILSFTLAGAAAISGGFLVLRNPPPSRVGGLQCGLVATGVACVGAW